MKKSLIIVTVISLLVAFSSVAFGQKNKKTNQNPSTATAGAEQQQTAAKQQTTTQKAQSKADFNRWYSAKAFTWSALAKLHSSNQYVDDNTYRLTKQYSSKALAKLRCHVEKISPCNDSVGEIENREEGDMRGVYEYLKDAKNALQKAAGTAEKDEVMSLLNRAIELANTYIQAHPPESSKKDESSNTSNKSNPPIDESTKTQKGQNPIADGTTYNTTSNSTQKTANPNSGFMDQPDDAVKSAPQNAKKTDNLGGDDDPEKTQRSSKAAKTNGKTQKNTNWTMEDQDLVKPKTTQRNAKTKSTNTKVRNSKSIPKTVTSTNPDAGYRDTDEDV
ncbi:MAG TPA: hypothetical protein PKY82_34260, partial [Pyrinomonadaceae bacterium]|nr:hypothetical protein [Pyrinomonadaceae bacterium]